MELSFTKTVVTSQGLELLTGLATSGGALRIMKAELGTGYPAPENLEAMTDLVNPFAEMEMLRGYTVSGRTVTIPLSYSNAEQTQAANITEIGVWADNGTQDILLCVIAGYDAPIPVPAAADARADLSVTAVFELANAANVTIVLPASLIYLTKETADTLYRPLGINIPASEVDETIGVTVEQQQRTQDEQIALLLQNFGGQTCVWTFATQDEVDSWTIARGILDQAQSVMTSGGGT